MKNELNENELIRLNEIKKRNIQRKEDDEQKKIIGNRYLNGFDALRLSSTNDFINIDQNLSKLFSLLTFMNISDNNKTIIYDIIIKNLRGE